MSFLDLACFSCLFVPASEVVLLRRLWRTCIVLVGNEVVRIGLRAGPTLHRRSGHARSPADVLVAGTERHIVTQRDTLVIRRKHPPPLMDVVPGLVSRWEAASDGDVAESETRDTPRSWTAIARL